MKIIKANIVNINARGNKFMFFLFCEIKYFYVVGKPHIYMCFIQIKQMPT